MDSLNTFVESRSAAEWHHLANAMPHLVWIAEANGEVVYYNDRVSEFSGATYSDGRWSWKGLVHSEDRERTSAAWNNAVLRGVPYEIRHRVKMKDGTYRWYLSRALPQHDESGNIVKWYGTATDIHLQTEFEAKNRANEKRLAGIFNQTSAGIAQCDLDGRFDLVNEHFCEITGRSEAQLKSLSIFSITHPDDLSVNRALLDDAMAHGKAFKLEKRYMRPDGTCVWVNINVNIVRDEFGNALYLLGVCHDITERKNAEEALRESEERFRTMADAAPNMVWALNPDGSVHYVNKYARNFFGIESTLHQNYAGFLHPDDLPQITHEMLTSISNRRTFRHEARFLRNSGEYRWMLLQGGPSYYPDGSLHGYVGSAIDIHDRKHVEELLRNQHLLIKGITDNATDPLFMVNASGICTFLNPAAEKLFGYMLKEISDQPLHNYIHFQRNGVPLRFEDCPICHGGLEHVELKGHEDVFYTRGGKVVPVKCSVKTVCNDGGVLGLLIEVRDITEEKRSDQALRESEERFRTMADNISPLAWMGDPEGNIFWYNKRWFDFTGTTPGEMQQHGQKLVVHPDYFERVKQKFEIVIKQGIQWEDTFPIRSKDGNYRWFLSRATPIRDERGTVLRWFGTNTDITERKETEEAVKMMANNLEKLVVERTIALQRSNEDLQQFAHVASHDLKEPLRKIKTFSNRLSEEYADKVGATGAMYLEKIENATERMFNMVDGVLNYSTINATRQRPVPVNLNGVLRHIESDLEVVIQEKSAILQYCELPTIEGAGVLLYQLFYNLINNSLKFTRNNATPLITVKAEPVASDDLFVRIIVADNGIGFEQEYAERIFQTFTRLHSKDRFEGTGIGLALCKKIVEWHKGSIEAVGQQGQGASFTITLPLKMRI